MNLSSEFVVGFSTWPKPTDKPEAVCRSYKTDFSQKSLVFEDESRILMMSIFPILKRSFCNEC